MSVDKSTPKICEWCHREFTEQQNDDWGWICQDDNDLCFLCLESWYESQSEINLYGD